MNAIDLNFATTPFRNKTPLYLGAGLGTALLVALTAYNSWAFFAYSESRSALETEHASKKAKLEHLYQDAARLNEMIQKENLGAINAQAEFTNALLERRRFSWTDLLNSLEEVQPYQVRLLSLLPRIQGKAILIDARAVGLDLESFYNFQQNLQNHPKFRRVYPGGYLRNPDENEYVFNVQFNYFPEGAPVDVQGTSPDEFLIVQAPGTGATGPIEETEPEPEEEIVEEPPPPAKKKSPTASQLPKPGPPGPVGGAQLPQPGFPQPPPGPAASAVPRNPNQPPQVPGAMPAAGVGTTGFVQGSANPNANPNADGSAQPRRWPGRGAIPGTAGARPPMPQKPEGAPRMPVLNPPPQPDETDEEEYEEEEDEDEEGDE